MFENADLDNKKYPGRFIIEIPIVNETIGPEYLKWIDICEYSAIPKEDEVILAPGCAFELLEVFTDEKKRTTIKLKLKQEVESLQHEGLIMQGAFQYEMTKNKQIKIMCLEGRELSETLKNMSGNRLIEEIEFYLCRFNIKSLEKMLNVLPSLKRVKSLKFVSCKYENEQGTPNLNLENCNDLIIEMSGFQNFYKIFNIQECDPQYWASWKTLKIDFRNLTKIYMKEAHNFMFQELRHLTQLTSLTLGFFCCEEVSGAEVTNLASQGLQNLKQLTSLTLNLQGCSKITDEGINNLALHGLKHLTQLTSFTFATSSISDEGMNNLASKGIKNLAKLTSLAIDFYCSNLTSLGMRILVSQGLQSLTHLTLLNLDFSRCPISDEGIKSLASQGLQFLTSLSSLTLNFSDCRIEDKGLSTLASEGLKYLVKLASLDLSFWMCYDITDEGLRSLAYQGLQPLIQLTSLKLTFGSPLTKISEKRASDLFSQGLEHLTQLTSLNLYLPQAIRLDILNNLVSQGLEYLPHLKSLTLNQQVIMSNNDNINKEEENKEEKKYKLSSFMKLLRRKAFEKFWQFEDFIHNLSSKWESSQEETPAWFYLLNPQKARSTITQFTNMSLRLSAHWKSVSYQEDPSTLALTICSDEPDEGVNNLVSQGLKNLIHLTSLTLDFKEITDKGMNLFVFQGLKYLTELTSLTLNFHMCFDLTDEGVSQLASQGLKYLSKLNSLTLLFRYYPNFTAEGMNNMASFGLKSLTQLTSLSLHFYPYILDNG